jgi:hypothetical protein
VKIADCCLLIADFAARWRRRAKASRLANQGQKSAIRNQQSANRAPKIRIA